MSEFTGIDVEELHPPLIFPDPSEETIFAELKARMIALNPEYEGALNLESEEITIAFQQFAYRLSVHQRDCNEGVLQQLLAFANDENLDWQGEVKGVGERHVVDPGDPVARPPVAPTYEDDQAYRRRIQLAPEGYSSAGPVGAYIYHALRADARVKDAFAYETGGAEVTIPILSREGNGEASAELINVVNLALNGEDMRPSNDVPKVTSAQILTYGIDGTLYFYSGPDRDLAFEQAKAQLLEFIAARHRLGDDIPISGIYAALHIPGVVSRVELRSPVQDIIVARDQAAWCDPETSVSLINGGMDD